MKLDIAGLTIDFDTRYPEYVRQRCSRYLADNSATPDIHITATESDRKKATTELTTPQEAELYAMSIPLSNFLPHNNRLMMHGVALGYNGKSYIFTAESGVGKSTHAFLWQKYLGKDRVSIINGDKPIIRLDEVPRAQAQSGSQHQSQNTFSACGTPWSGKEGLDVNTSLPLGGICLLRRLECDPEGGNRIYKATEGEAFDFLLHQIYIPTSTSGMVKTLNLLELLFNTVPVYHLVADISEDAFRISFNTLCRRR